MPGNRSKTAAIAGTWMPSAKPRRLILSGRAAWAMAGANGRRPAAAAALRASRRVIIMALLPWIFCGLLLQLRLFYGLQRWSRSHHFVLIPWCKGPRAALQHGVGGHADDHQCQQQAKQRRGRQRIAGAIDQPAI